MPLFGNRMVVATANYKHIEEKKKEFFDRESGLGRWVTERKARKEKLRELQERIRQNSLHSQEDINSGREVALEEPQNPEILEESYAKVSVPETQFTVEEEDFGPHYPCSQCVIQ